MHTHFIRYITTILIVALLQACGGSSTSSGPKAIISGVAATGAAIDGTVTVKDSTGITRSSGITLPSGTYSMDVSGLTPPYFLKATNNAGTLTLYSIATGSGTFNINPLSNLVIVAAAMSIDPLAKTPDAVFNNPANFSTLTAAQIQSVTNTVMAQMSPAFQAALAANGASNINPLTDSYQIGNALDKVFDSFVVTLNSSTGEVLVYQVCRQTSANAGSTTPPAGTMIITAIPACKTYDGQSYSGGNGVAYNGFLNNDTPSVLDGILTYGGTSQGAKNVGTYTITLGGLTSSSYNIIYVDSTLTVSPLTLPTIINNTSHIYVGTATLGTTAFTVSLTGGDTITLSAANAGTVSGGGTYTIAGGNAANSGLTGTTTSVPTISAVTLNTGP